MPKHQLFAMIHRNVWFSVLVFWFPTTAADVIIGCVSEQLSAEFSEMVSVEDIAEGSETAQMIIELPLSYSGLVLEYIHLRRFEKGKRVLWIGLPFKELNKNRSWSTVEILRTDLNDYKFFAEYRTKNDGRKECSYEFPIIWKNSN